MSYNTNISDILGKLNEENIKTWFDLGLFLDRLKENRNIPHDTFHGSFHEYEQLINNSGVAFLTYHFTVDGVTVETGKYVQVFKRLFPRTDIHYIGGIFKAEGEKLIPGFVKKHEISILQGFDDWKLYCDFYFTRLERGSETYNRLIGDFWQETLEIVEKLGSYILKNQIRLLYLLNVCSNPGNVSFSLACVLLSEYLGIPVINNNHDFYWEGGKSETERKKKELNPGPRDFFFTNSHLGEIFSVIEMLFPWESRTWINLNINRAQSRHLVSTNGINPANVMEIGTAVDTEVYRNINKRKKISAFLQFEKILSRYQDRLTAFSPEDVIHNHLVDPGDPQPILVSWKTKVIDRFISENIIFLQPTRIISRKRIETGFRLLLRMLNDPVLKERMRQTKFLKITILVTGPVAAGHYDYFENLIRAFAALLVEIDESFRERIFLAFLFSELDKESFKRRFAEPVGIPELYNISSLVLLPSKTEGRGLPIIEATACSIPIFCRRYKPKNVYSEVIGEHLDEKDRLKVIEYDGKYISSKHIEDIIQRVFFPHKFSEEFTHNREVVVKRYSLEALYNNIRDVLYRLYLQSRSNRELMDIVAVAFDDYRRANKYDDANFRAIMNTKNRQYLPGYGKLAFMICLKSLIDPSYFRIEEKEFRGKAFHFALEMIRELDPELMDRERIVRYFNAVDNLFHYRKGEVETLHDHSMVYRHRNRNYYPYQDFSIQELTGLINILYTRIIQPVVISRVKETPHFFTDWNLALLQLTGSNDLAIDNRERLIKKLKANLPIAYFPGEFIMHELEFFAVQSIRSRLGLKIEDVLSRELLEKQGDNLERVYIFAQEKNPGKQLNREEIIEYIHTGKNEELKLLYETGIMEIIPTRQWTVGIHFAQLGKDALSILKLVKKRKGFLLTNRRNASLMTDIVDIDRFHIGKVRTEIGSHMIGIPRGSGYIQFVPAGIRTTLAYPTPVQTAYSFYKSLKSQKFRELANEMGEDAIYERLKEDAENQGSPVEFVLDQITGKETTNENLNYKYISGVYKDGFPYNGVVARLRNPGKDWNFAVEHVKGPPLKVTEIVNKFERKRNVRSGIAWNGGYILNAELVGKLGIPESYIGSPLGLIINESRIISPPLFNKPALLIMKDGKADIQRVNSAGGMVIRTGGKEFNISPEMHNQENACGDVCYYDLMWDKRTIPGRGRVIVRMAGNRIKEIIRTGKQEDPDLLPVGINFSFDPEVFPEGIREGDEVVYLMKAFSNVEYAIEAGPLLIDEGEIALDMMSEGWKTDNSIRTQAARIDYEDMRGPKIAAGIDRKGNLAVLAINGRIRESVGASHLNMADIMKNLGMHKAMGFDPGGSSTLVVNGRTVNISPYNHKYEEDVFSLPPEPRAVSNAIIVYNHNR